MLAQEQGRKVYDCFLFFNELDILEIRLRELNNCVDFFVIVESVETFQGNKKELYFRNNISRFKNWRDKIIHVVLEPGKTRLPGKWAGAWRREFWQRSQIKRGLSKASPNDIIIISDVDEILRSAKLEELKRDFDEKYFYIFQLSQHSVFLNTGVIDSPWDGPRVIVRKKFPGAQYLRLMKLSPSRFWYKYKAEDIGIRLQNLQRGHKYMAGLPVPDGGWHFSYIGGFERFRAKIDAFSHVEYKSLPRYSSREEFDKWVGEHDLFDLDQLPRAAGLAKFRHLLATPGQASGRVGRSARRK